MERDADEIARLSVLDNGMTAGMSQPLVGIMANWTSYYAGWADKVEGRVTSFPANQRELAYSMPEPMASSASSSPGTARWYPLA